MAYAYVNTRGTTYYLHQRTTTLKGSNASQVIYYFSKEPGEGALDRVPDGYEVFESSRGALPLLRKRVATGSAS